MSAAQVKYATRLGIILLVVALMGFGTVKDIFQNLGDTMVEWTDGDGYTSRAQAQANVPQEAHIEAGVTQHFVTPDTCDFSFQKSQGVAVMINYTGEVSDWRSWISGPVPVHTSCVREVWIRPVTEDVYFRIVP